MNKHTVIVIISVVVIVGTIAYSFVNATTASDIQLRWHQKNGFDYLAMMAGGKVEICNPTSIPVDFQKLKIEPHYKERKLGAYIIDGAILQPSASTEISGTAEKDNAGQFLLSQIGSKLEGENIARIDLERLEVHMEIKTNVLGFIPYSTTDVYSGYDFNKMMNHAGSFDC